MHYENHQSRLRALIRYDAAAIEHQIKTLRAEARRDRSMKLYDEKGADAEESRRKRNDSGNHIRNIIRRNAEAKASRPFPAARRGTGL